MEGFGLSYLHCAEAGKVASIKVVKRARPISDDDLHALGAKRSVRERLESNMNNSNSCGRHYENKCQRTEGHAERFIDKKPRGEQRESSAYLNPGEPLTVGDMLKSLGLGKYSILFQAEEVDMTALRQMRDNDLKELGIPMAQLLVWFFYPDRPLKGHVVWLVIYMTSFAFYLVLKL